MPPKAVRGRRAASACVRGQHPLGQRHDAASHLDQRAHAFDAADMDSRLQRGARPLRGLRHQRSKRIVGMREGHQAHERNLAQLTHRE